MKMKDEPIYVFPFESDSVATFHYGMTLRDYFAAQAMLISAKDYFHECENYDYEAIAELAYTLADAMLKARKENTSREIQ